MATSGTVAQTAVTLDYIIEAAGRRCGVQADMLTPEGIEVLKTTLFTMLSDWGSRGIKLWRVKRSLVGLQLGQADYELGGGTIDVLNANFRQPQRLVAETLTSSAGGTASYATDGEVDTILTQTAMLGNLQFDWGADNDGTIVNMVGLMPGATATVEVILEYSTDGVAWLTVDDLGELDLVDGLWQWFAIEPAYPARYFRVRMALGTLVMREVYLSQEWTDVTMYRMNKDDYMSLPNKRFASAQVYQYWLDRRRDDPAMVLWPVPGNTFTLMALMTHVYIEDLGDLTNEPDVPQRWLEPVISSLALRALPELPKADVARYEMLKDAAQEPRFDAEAEEVDRSPIMLTPQIAGYTR